MAPGIWQILVIVVLVLLVFGAGRLPRIMEDVAKGIKGFKKGLKDDEDGDKSITHKNDNVIDAEVEDVTKTKEKE